MIHARQRGESFGLSIAEFLYHNKPVLSWEGGVDQNHVEMLKDSTLMYNESNIKDKLLFAIEEGRNLNSSWRVEQYSPQKVMKKFEEVFLC